MSMMCQGSDISFGSWGRSDEDAEKRGFKAEWDEYLDAAHIKDLKGFSVRRWWIGQQDRFPISSQVALELLAIPAMSTEIERVLSGYILQTSLINGASS